MPSFKSKEQMNKLARLVEKGKFSKKLYEEMEKETDRNSLPDRVEAKPKGIIRGVRRDRRTRK